MPDYRKPPVQTPARPEGSPPADDSGQFSIETTTMRLKSLKLRRTEAADQELKQRLRDASGDSRQPAPEENPGGRVRHDDRGQAVWDLAVASGEFAALSATNVMRKLDVADLKIEESQRTPKLKLETGVRDAGGGSDPYNQRSGASADPFKRGAISGGGSDPYNQARGGGGGGNPYDQTARPMKRPAPAASPKPAAPVSGKVPGRSVLDQLTGRKK